jgi:hypothetical protein
MYTSLFRVDTVLGLEEFPSGILNFEGFLEFELEDHDNLFTPWLLTIMQSILGMD